MASNQASENGKPGPSGRLRGGKSGGGRLRSLIPFFRKRPRPATMPPQVATSSLAVRPSWWRGAVQRMVGGLWPGFRTGQDTTTSDRSSAPSRPLVVRRRPLAGRTPSLVQVRREVKRAPLTAPDAHAVRKSTVFSGLTPQPTPPLTMAPFLGAPPPGAPSGAGAVESAPGRAAATQVGVSQTGWTEIAATGPVSARPVSTGLASTQLAASLSAAHQPVSNPLEPSVSAQGVVGSADAVPLAKQPQHVIVRREAARLALATPPSRSLAHPPKHAHQHLQVGTRTSQVRVQRTESATHSQSHSHSPEHVHAHGDNATVTPEQRWREVVAQAPLETPLPFPKHMQPLVAQLTGKAHGARYTTGSATRRALNEVGALGATTGSVVHLAQQPSMAPSSMGVLAHELTHARVPVSRPRFMLHNHTGAMDSDERQARSVGSMFQGASLSPASPSAAPMRVQRFGLPSASGLVGGLRDQATSAVSSLGNQATGAVGGLRDRATSAIGDGASAVTNQVSSAASGLSDRFTSAAGDFGNRMASEASTVTAGIVDNLPVGGGANGVVTAVSQMAQTVVENAVREATQTATAQASQAVGEVTQAAQNMASNLQSMATDGVNGLAGQANQMASGAMGQATGALQGLGDQAMGALGDAQNAVTSGVGGLANQAMGAAGNVLGPGAAQAISGLDLDRLAEALEERLLRQLERRGGRYAGVF